MTFINQKITIKDDFYYILNGFKDVTKEFNGKGLYVPEGEIHSSCYGSWEMNGYIYETFKNKFYRKPKVKR